MSIRPIKPLIKSITLAAAVSFACGNSYAADSLDLDIPSNFAGPALMQLAKSAHVQILVPEGIAKSITLPALEGRYSLRSALDSILTGTGLEYKFTSERSIVIQPDAKKSLPSKTSEDNDDIEEIIVTGSNIRGLKDGPSPVFIYTREDIDKTGVATTHEFIQTLTQNFSGGASEASYNVEGDVASADYAGSNINGGSGVNLRGLGNDSSLVLINGHRVAPSSPGGFVDISMIPVSAIERIEVLTDGASAIYGSDAVGGVVNFILRDDFDGAETRVRYGAVTQGDMDEYQLGQTFGHSWSEGHVLLSYEYYRHAHLDAQERSFSSDTTIKPYSLLPQQKRHSAFMTASQQLTDNIKLLADAFYNTRESQAFNDRGVRGTNRIAENEQFGITFGPTIQLTDSWQMNIVGSYTTNHAEGASYYLDTGEITSSSSRVSEHDGKTWSLDVKADGSLFSISGGNVRAAIGGHYRKESYETPDFETAFFVYNESRDVKSVFGEVFVPIIGEPNQIRGVDRLELTFAIRRDKYSEFGSTSDPKVGVLWSPFEGLNFRSSWGTSFRVPLFTELAGPGGTSLIANFPNLSSPTGKTLALVAYGRNSGLQPEEATTWTAGFDFQPAAIPGLDLRIDYFNIDFRDRIEAVIVGFNDAFNDPRYATITTFNPSPEFVDEIVSTTDFFNYTIFPGFGPFAEIGDVEAFLDNRIRNNAVNKTTGIDFALGYDMDTDFGVWGFTFGGTYLFGQKEQISPDSPAVDVVDTTFHPVDLKVRSGITWGHEAISAGLYLNYVDEYLDDRVRSASGNQQNNDPVPASPISSWTTVDLNVSYSTDYGSRGFLDGTVISLNVRNMFDRDPPYVEANGFSGAFVNFDSNNATAVGRFVSINLTKSW